MFSLAVAAGLELRLLEERHADRIFALVHRNRAHIGAWLPWVESTRSAEDVRGFIRKARAQFDAGEGPHCGIWWNGSVAGGIGCRAIDWANRATSIGYWVGAEFQRQGLVTRSCRALLDHLFFELRLHRIEIRCAIGNVRSCAIPERLGFTREGIAREAEFVNGRFEDLVVWSVLEPEWRDGAQSGRSSPKDQ
jgi:ribosomal-protein-serine acetyltransferase